MNGEESGKEVTTFWGHLDVFRSSLVHIALAVVVLSAVCFFLKRPLFDFVLAPSSSDFISYRLMGVDPFKLHLMNTGLTEQFFIHVKTSVYAGVLLASPYLLYELFKFVSPALYANERRYAVKVVGSAYLMFLFGSAVNYLLIFPLTVYFLGNYQVSPDVDNMLTISSYMNTLINMSLVMGLIFELPVVCWLLSVMGILTKPFMRKRRRHAIAIIFIAAAIITPTGDAFTLIVVSLPIWLLYEMSIMIVRK